MVFVEGAFSGTVRVGTESLRNVFIQADSGALTSRGRVDADGNSAPELPYELPVNIPEGETLTYDVRARPVNLTDGGRIDFPRQRVDIAGGDDLTVDFVLDDPGFVEGQVRVLDGGAFDPDLLSSALIGWSGEGFVYTTRTDRARDGFFRIAVKPGTVNLIASAGSGCCWVQLQDGTTIRIFPTPDQRNLSVAAGETLTFDLEIEAPATGTIAGTVNMPGPFEVGIRGVAVIGNGINSGFSTNALGEFSRDALVEGTYSLRVTTLFNGGSDYFRHPGTSFVVGGVPQANTRVEVVGGQTTLVAVSSDQAFIDGVLDLTGSVTGDDLSVGRVQAMPPTGPAGLGGEAQDSAAADGVFDLVVSPGEWELTRYLLELDRDDPLRPIDTNLTIYPAAGFRPSASPAAGETVALAPIELATGTLTINFESLDGTSFSGPRVSGACLRDSAGGERILRADVFARDDTVEEVTQARVVMVGVESQCTLLTARAFVDGALVTFGTLSAGFIPGVDQETDLGAPALAVEFPEPGLITGDAQLVVSGRATDDVVVAEVTVAGVAAALAPSGNPDDDVEVTFEQTIELEPGPNQILTVATDGEGKQASDTRTVFFDPVDNRPPVADAGADQVVEQQSPAGAVVLLDGSGSFDPDDDPLSFGWSGPFGTAAGPGPEVLLAAGAHVVTLVVDDGTVASAADTAEVTVQDTTAPDFTRTQLETNLWPPNHRMVLVATVAGVSDLADPSPAVSIDVTSNQPIDGPGDGSTAPDWQVTENGDSWEIRVRAERSGALGDRTYTITTTVADVAGNVASETCAVTVAHDRGR